MSKDAGQINPAEAQWALFRDFKEIEHAMGVIDTDYQHFDGLLDIVDTSHLKGSREELLATIADQKQEALDHLRDLRQSLRDMFPRDVFIYMQTGGRGLPDS